MNATDQQPGEAGAQPTIVLVHGAFADASSWNGVVERLQQQGWTVIAPANPLRGVAADSAYIASLLSQIDGRVLLAGTPTASETHPRLSTGYSQAPVNVDRTWSVF